MDMTCDMELEQLRRERERLEREAEKAWLRREIDRLKREASGSFVSARGVLLSVTDLYGVGRIC